ncbi:MAG: EamA family transporter, partial [Evtepia sp.]
EEVHMIEDIMASWWWLILAALGLPSALTGFFIRRMEKRLEKREAQRKKEQDALEARAEEREKKREQLEMVLIQSTSAAIALGVFQLGLAYIFFTTGIKYAPPVSASLMTGIEPILNPVLVALVLGEMISPLSLLGGAVVFVTIMVYNVIGARAEQKDTCQGEPV